MYEINLPENVYKVAERQAQMYGHPNVEAYLTELIEEDGGVPDSFWTPARLAEIDEASREVDEGKTVGVDEAFASLFERKRGSREGEGNCA